jgi:hypothetical protein
LCARQRLNQPRGTAGGGAKQDFGQELAHQGIAAPADVRPGVRDPIHVRQHMVVVDFRGDAAEIAPEILFLIAFGNGDVGGDADDDFMQCQALRPERRQLLLRQSGQRGEFVDFLDAGAHALRPEDRLQRAELRRDARADAGIPGRCRRLRARFVACQRHS